jgi:hypothetical protein
MFSLVLCQVPCALQLCCLCSNQLLPPRISCSLEDRLGWRAGGRRFLVTPGPLWGFRLRNRDRSDLDKLTCCCRRLRCDLSLDNDATRRLCREVVPLPIRHGESRRSYTSLCLRLTSSFWAAKAGGAEAIDADLKPRSA